MAAEGDNTVLSLASAKVIMLYFNMCNAIKCKISYAVWKGSKFDLRLLGGHLNLLVLSNITNLGCGMLSFPGEGEGRLEIQCCIQCGQCWSETVSIDGRQGIDLQGEYGQTLGHPSE